MTPRTACTAIAEVLCSEFGGEYLPQEDITDSQGAIRVQKKHSTLQQLLQNGLLDIDQAASLLKFCSVRNPFDSLVSLYIKEKYKYQPLLADPSSWVHGIPGYAKDMTFCRTHSFNSWIIKRHLERLLGRILGFKFSIFEDFTQGVDVVMRYENITKDFQNVLKKANISFRSSIPVVNPTTERPTADYRPYYSRLSRRIVEFVYDYDLNTYGYSF